MLIKLHGFFWYLFHALSDSCWLKSFIKLVSELLALYFELIILANLDSENILRQY